MSQDFCPSFIKSVWTENSIQLVHRASAEAEILLSVSSCDAVLFHLQIKEKCSGQDHPPRSGKWSLFDSIWITPSLTVISQQQFEEFSFKIVGIIAKNLTWHLILGFKS